MEPILFVLLAAAMLVNTVIFYRLGYTRGEIAATRRARIEIKESTDQIEEMNRLVRSLGT